jgi:hypothetical protein
MSWGGHNLYSIITTAFFLGGINCYPPTAVSESDLYLYLYLYSARYSISIWWLGPGAPTPPPPPPPPPAPPAHHLLRFSTVQ